MKKCFIVFTISIWAISLTAQDDSRKLFFPNEEIKVEKIPRKKNIWIFILAGQSNMAGRGLVESQDTIPNERVLTINKGGDVIIAKEPLHFYEPQLTGLDCGYSFAKSLTQQLPENISVLIIPTAVGGSSITQWLGDSLHRSVRLLTNFKEKIGIGRKYGHIKGILWHQGESDANPKNIPLYKSRLAELTSTFRKITKNKKLPILIGELGSYSNNNESWMKINEQILLYVSTDPYSKIIRTSDLNSKEDKIHFDSAGQRLMGKRFAQEFLTYLK